MNIVIKNPDGKSIPLEVVEFEQRNRLLKNESVKLFKVDKNFIRDREIYQLKDSKFLSLHTVDSYGFIFKNEEGVNLFHNNDAHFTISLIRDNNIGKFYYSIQLHNAKTNELRQRIIQEIPGYPSESNFKTYLLDSGAYLRMSKRPTIVEIYDSSWFPDLENFEWFYNQQFTD